MFANLTNAYCLTAIGGSENFYRFVSQPVPLIFNLPVALCVCRASTFLAFDSVFQNELASDIPVVKTSIAGTRLVGRMTVGACACDPT